MSKILLAEDDPSTRQFLAGTLEKAGHAVTPCADGLEAWQAYEAAPDSFDLLVTDIVMRGLDGVELARRIKSRRPDMKIMFITGFAGMVEGEAKVISKPFHLGDITREIEQMLAG